VPATALIAGANGGKAVYLIEGDIVHRRAVTPGPARGELQSVSGISAGARVVRAPPEGLHDGARISIGKAGS